MANSKKTNNIPEILVTGRHTNVTEQVKDYVHTKVLRTIKNVPKVHGVHVILDVERYKKKAEVVVVLHHMKVRAAADSEDILASVDIVVDKLKKQLSKYKGKLQAHHKGPGLREVSIMEEFLLPHEDEEINKKSKLIRTRDFAPKPMSADEARMQLGLTSELFLVFQNSQTSQVNVVYLRKDGNIGWIEPS